MGGKINASDSGKISQKFLWKHHQHHLFKSRRQRWEQHQLLLSSSTNVTLQDTGRTMIDGISTRKSRVTNHGDYTQEITAEK